MAGKFYAVKKGKVPGIYTSWDACKSMVHGFPGADQFHHWFHQILLT